jgi:uncharacterized protein YprB with RNaseH-like and TPR domain
VRTVLVDIETTDLAANMGIVLCVSYKPYLSGRVRTIAIDTDRLKRAHKEVSLRGTRAPDFHVVKDTFRALKEFDILVTFNGRKFDVPFLRARALILGLEGSVQNLPKWHIDLSNVLRGTSARIVGRRFISLAQVQGFLGIPEKEGKTPLSYETWSLAHFGSAKALREVVIHCERDVLVLEKAYERARDLIKTIPKT